MKNQPDKEKVDVEMILKLKKKLGLISHPGAESGNVPTPSPLIDKFHYGGFTREEWLRADMLPCGLSQSRAAMIMTVERLHEPDDVGLAVGLLKGIEFLTFLIGDDFKFPPDGEGR